MRRAKAIQQHVRRTRKVYIRHLQAPWQVIDNIREPKDTLAVIWRNLHVAILIVRRAARPEPSDGTAHSPTYRMNTCMSWTETAFTPWRFRDSLKEEQRYFAK